MHSILRQQAAQFVAVGGCGCLTHNFTIIQAILSIVNRGG